MKRNKAVWFGVTGALVLAGGLPFARAERENPYQVIIDRNVFGLRPPPPPQVEIPPPPPPLPPTTVKLTGITSFGKNKALLEITPGPGKPAIKPILEEGERSEGVEVISIDPVKSIVTIKNSGLLTNITFEVAKASSAPAPAGPGTPAAPGFPGMQGGVPPPINAPGGFNPGAGINSGAGAGAGGRGGVTLMGGGGQSSFANSYGNTAGGAVGGGGVATYGAPQPTAINPGLTPVVPGTPGSVYSGLSGEGIRSIPPRQSRVGASAEAGGSPDDLRRSNVPFPLPTDPDPSAQQGGGGGPPAPPFRRPGFPTLPGRQ